MIRVFLADDHEIFRNGLKSLLEANKEFKVVGQAGDGEELLERINTSEFDCLVLDLSMPNMDGLQALEKIHTLYPKLKCMVLTMHKDAEHYKRAMALGAQGYVLKDCAFDELIVAIQCVLSGKHYVSPSISDLIAQQYVRSLDKNAASVLNILTEREKQIVGFIADGMANKNIAAHLKISIRTVEAHRNRLNHKLGVKNTASLVKYAMENGIASPIF